MEQCKTVRIGILGLGIIGTAVVKTLQNRREDLFERWGLQFEIVKVLVQDPDKFRQVELEPGVVTTDSASIVEDRTIDVVIEVMGGVSPAYQLAARALELGKHVVTANKALIAAHGTDLQKIASAAGVHLLYEASVCAGVPIIRLLQTYLSVNQIRRISGIVNGTTNFILSEMSERKLDFQPALQKAQQLGYAESDPTADVEGWDAVYKLAILSALAFGKHVKPAEISRAGIRQITRLDLELARQLGVAIKLLAEASCSRGGRFTACVGPYVLPLSHPLARINGVQNAVQLSGDVVGDLIFAGAGAGGLPTASGVLEDLVSLFNGSAYSTRVYPTDTETLGTESMHGAAGGEDEELFYVRVSFRGLDADLAAGRFWALQTAALQGLDTQQVRICSEPVSVQDQTSLSAATAFLAAGTRSNVEDWLSELDALVLPYYPADVGWKSSAAGPSWPEAAVSHAV